MLLLLTVLEDEVLVERLIGDYVGFMGQNGGDALMWNEEYTSINPQVLNQPVQKDITCFNTLIGMSQCCCCLCTSLDNTYRLFILWTL